MTASEVKEALSAQYPYRIELHAHSCPASGCSELAPEELVRRYAERGYHGIVLTNHLDPWRLRLGQENATKMHMADYEMALKAGEKYGIAVYLGVELRFQENSNDYLIYGVDEEVVKTCCEYVLSDAETFRKNAVLPGSLFLQAHPFRPGMVLCAPELLDGMECINLHPKHNSSVGVATRYAYETGLKVKIAGSDCHHPGHEGLTALRTSFMPGDSFKIAKLLQDGDYIFELGDGSLWLP